MSHVIRYDDSPERNSNIGAAMETVAEIWVKRTKRAGRRLRTKGIIKQHKKKGEKL